MAYFPLFFNMEGKRVVVIGGGRIAARRVKALMEFGCEIVIISPEICDEIKTLAEDEKITWICERYCGQIEQYAPFFVLAAAGSEVNKQVTLDCKAAGILVNDASKKENCDFYFPGLIRDGETVIGVTTGGSDHKRAAALSEQIRELIRRT